MPAQFQTIKSVFNGGEMSPLMDGRTDAEKYATGCRVLENFIVKPQGGVFKRPGTQLLGSTQPAGIPSAPVVLLPFRDPSSESYLFVATATGIRVTDRDGATVGPAASAWISGVEYLVGDYIFPTPGSFYYCLKSHTASASFATDNAAGLWLLRTTGYQMPLTSADLDEVREIKFVQLNDQMFLTRGNMHPKRITRRAGNKWAIENVPFQFAPTLDPEDDNITMTLVLDADDWVASTLYQVGDYVLYLNELYRCKTANSDATFTGSKWDKATYLTSWNVGQAYVAGNVVEYFGSNYFCITAHTSSTANNPSLLVQWVLVPFLDYRLIASAAVFDATEVDSTWLLQPGSTERVIRETIPASQGTTTTATIFIQGDFLVKTTWGAATSPNGLTLRLEESLNRLDFTSVKEWAFPSALEATIAYSSTAPQEGAWYRLVSVKTLNVNTGHMIIEPGNARLDIPFLIQSYISTTQVRGVAKLAAGSLIPNEVLGVAFPVWRRGAFNSTRGYPAAVAFHDSRLWLGGTATEPSRLWGSQIDDFYTFQGGALDTSGIDVTLAATEVNPIRSMESYNRALVIFTTNEEWSLDSGDTDTVITPSKLRVRRRSRYGSIGIQPVVASDALLFVDKANHLRELAYRFETDSYTGPDMNLLAGHLTAKTPIQTAFSQSPDPILWMVTDEGSLLGFSYDREQNVTAWHRHRTGETDAFISVCVLPSTAGVDEVFFVVKRAVTNGSGTAYYIEKFPETALLWASGRGDQILPDSASLNQVGFYSDCHWKQAASGGSLAVPSLIQSNGLSVTLGGPTVAASGAPLTATLSGATVNFGITIPAGTYYVGIPFTAIMIPNRMEVQLQKGTAQMSKWRIVKAAFRLWRSMYGQVCEKLDQVEFTTASRIETPDLDTYPDYNNPTNVLDLPWGQTLAQGIGGNHRQCADICITSRHAMPFNVLSVLLDVEIGYTSSAP